MSQPVTAWRHAKGFKDYVRATLETAHAVPATTLIDGVRVCARCTYPVKAQRSPRPPGFGQMRVQLHNRQLNEEG